MKTTWILAANRSGAKFYEHTVPGSLKLLQEIKHPEGRLQNREIGTDQPGRTAESGGVSSPQGGVKRSGYGEQVEPTRHLAQGFAHALAEMVGRARTDHAYDELILMAEPRFLGMLRQELDAPTAATVVGSVEKEMPLATEAEMKEQLRDVLRH